MIKWFYYKINGSLLCEFLFFSFPCFTLHEQHTHGMKNRSMKKPCNLKRRWRIRNDNRCERTAPTTTTHVHVWPDVVENFNESRKLLAFLYGNSYVRMWVCVYLFKRVDYIHWTNENEINWFKTIKSVCFLWYSFDRWIRLHFAFDLRLICMRRIFRSCVFFFFFWLFVFIFSFQHLDVRLNLMWWCLCTFASNMEKIKFTIYLWPLNVEFHFMYET